MWSSTYWLIYWLICWSLIDLAVYTSELILKVKWKSLIHTTATNQKLFNLQSYKQRNAIILICKGLEPENCCHICRAVPDSDLAVQYKDLSICSFFFMKLVYIIAQLLNSTAQWSVSPAGLLTELSARVNSALHAWWAGKQNLPWHDKFVNF